MEGDTYAQIHYNPDDLDDVSVKEVECRAEAEPENSPMTEPEEVDTQVFETAEEMINETVSEPEAEVNQEVSEAVEEQIPEESDETKEPETKTVPLPDEIQELIRQYAESAEDIQRTLRRLERKFTDEVLNGENRDSSVKTMYKELNEYKAGIVEKALKNVLYDMVDIRETMLSQIRFLREKKGVESISLDEFESYADDIGDILEKHDVTIYKGEIGEENVAVRQKIVRKVETEDEALVKKVAESLSYGYEYGSKILYPEKISVYIKNNK